MVFFFDKAIFHCGTFLAESKLVAENEKETTKVKLQSVKAGKKGRI